jgi:iron complex transport system substrate-binding protein
VVALAVGVVKRASALALTAFLLAAGTACGIRSEPRGVSVPLYPVTVQGAGDSPIVLRNAPQRIVAVAVAPAQILVALGVGGRLVGRPAPSPDAVTAPDGEIRLRTIQQLHPDLVVGSAFSDPLDLAHIQRATHAQVYVTPGNSIRDVERAITELGLATDEPLAARRLVERIKTRVHEVTSKVASAPVFSVFVDTGFFTTVSDRSLLGDMIRIAHGRNIAGPSPETGPFDLDELARLDPDVYLTLSDTETTLAELRQSPKTRRLRAIRTGHFGIVPAQLVRPGPDAGDGLLAVARALHPDAFR